MKKVFLASQSPQRQTLMRVLGVPFESRPADLDELQIQDDDQVKRAAMVARAKAEKILLDQSETESLIVIAGDTYVLSGDNVLEKPATVDEAREMLKLISGQEITVLTGFCYLDKEAAINVSTTVVVTAKFRVLLPAEIEWYVTTQPVTTWSGGFSMAYPEGALLIDELHGSYTAFVYGLPVETLVPLLQQSGVYH